MYPNNNFQTKDQLGRDQFKQLCNHPTQQWCKHVADATDDYSIWDTAYLSGYTNNANKLQVLGEIKYRSTYNSDAFDCWLMEVDKFKALQNKKAAAKKHNKEISLTYINIFNDNMTYVWNITDLNLSDYTITQRWLPKNNFDDTVVLKDVIYLKSTISEKYETNEDLSIFNKPTNNDDDTEFPF